MSKKNTNSKSKPYTTHTGHGKDNFYSVGGYAYSTREEAIEAANKSKK